MDNTWSVRIQIIRRIPSKEFRDGEFIIQRPLRVRQNSYRLIDDDDIVVLIYDRQLVFAVIGLLRKVYGYFVAVRDIVLR